MSDIETVEGTITPTEGAALSLINYYADGGKKARYLSYLVAGFSKEESIVLAKIHMATVKRWRRDECSFEDLEQKSLGELREELSNQLINIEFTRNFRLVLAKDFQILFKDAQDKVLTEKEQQYLLVIRKFYTPEQLTRIRQLVSGKDDSGEAFDFTRTVLTIRLEKEERSVR